LKAGLYTEQYQIIQLISNFITIGFILLVFVTVIKQVWNMVSKPVEATATVIDRRESSYTKYTPAPIQATDYIIVFKSGDKSLSFSTSIWNYDAVKKGQHGILKYKGNHMISFITK